MRIAIIPYEERHAIALAPDTAQDRLTWLEGAAEPGRTIADMTPDEHLLVVACSAIYRPISSRVVCKVSIIISEPPGFHARHYRFLRWFGGRYHRILTHNTRLLQARSNARFLAHGMTWVTDPHRDYSQKTSRISIVASGKNALEGHRLRLRLVEWGRREVPDLDVFGRAFRPIADKAEGHAPHMFSVVVENSREPGYFTEKIIDSLVCLSLPIYWGAPDIAHFFDQRGLIICTSEDELKHAMRVVTAQDYERRKPYLIENRKRALNYLGYDERAAQLLMDEDRLALPASPPRGTGRMS